MNFDISLSQMATSLCSTISTIKLSKDVQCLMFMLCIFIFYDRCSVELLLLVSVWTFVDESVYVYRRIQNTPLHVNNREK